MPIFALCPRDYSGGVVAKFMFGGKDKTGDGTPEGLPLICRFFLALTLSCGHPLPVWEGQG